MSYRVLRGGSFKYAARSLRTTRRIGYVPEDRSGRSGFRIVVKRRKS